MKWPWSRRRGRPGVSVEARDGVVFYREGTHIEWTADGGLVVRDKAGSQVAYFASGTWLGAEVARFFAESD